MQYLSASPGHIAADAVGVRGPENDLVVPSFPSAASAPELHAVDTSENIKVGQLPLFFKNKWYRGHVFSDFLCAHMF